MNIYAEKGHKVIVTEQSKNNGHSHDKENVKKFLKVGRIYEVDRTEVSDWETRVFMKEAAKVN